VTTVAIPAVGTTVATTSAEDPTSAPLSVYPNRGARAVPQYICYVSLLQ